MEYKNVTFVLASMLSTYTVNEFDVKMPIAMQNENGVLDAIKDNLSGTNLCLIIANDPNNYEKNDEKCAIFTESLEKAGLKFNQTLVLDNRTKELAPLNIKRANLILLQGGKIICQNEFLKEIRFADRLKFSNAVVIGVSAGAMNLAKEVYNFPESRQDLSEMREIKGLSFYDKIIIPHFDGDNLNYQLPLDDNIDPVKDYILPYSNKKSLLGLPNGSFVLVKNKIAEIFGKHYIIENRQVTAENDSPCYMPTNMRELDNDEIISE